MKNVNLPQYCLSAFSSAFIMDDISTILHETSTEPNLEELISSVFVGKTAIDKVSGKCILESNEKDASSDVPSSGSSSNSGNFDPLILPVVENKFWESSTSEKESCKRSKVLSINEYSEHKQSVEDYFEPANSRNQISNNSQISGTSQRLKRKRHLLDDESDLLCNIADDVMDDQCNVIFSLSNKSAHSQIEDEAQNEKHKDNEMNSTDSSQTEDITCQISVKPHPLFDHNEKSDNFKSSNIEFTASRLSNFHELSLKESNYKETTCVTEYSDSISKSSMCSDEHLLSEDAPGDVSFSNNSTSKSPSANSTENITEVDMKQCSVPAEKRKLENEPDGRSLRKRIRKTLPPLKTRHTPLGLPKPLRLKKVSFSLEEIYTNKNYSTPVPKMLETIFEYPKEDGNGHIKYSEKRRKQRAMYFSTNPANRPTKKRGKNKFKKRTTRRNNSENDVEADTKLINVLADLDRQLELGELSP